MTRLHKWFTDVQVRVLFKGYCPGLLVRAKIQEMLGIGKTRFFALLKKYQEAPETFPVAYERRASGWLPAAAEVEIERCGRPPSALWFNTTLRCTSGLPSLKRSGC